MLSLLKLMQRSVKVIKGRLSRALQLYSFIALGAVVHLLHKRRAVDDLETLKMLSEEDNENDGAFSPETMSRLKAVAATLPLKTAAAPESAGELPAARIELTAVVFIHVYGLVAWGDPTAGGSIPLSLSQRLSAGITFAVGNTRAFAAVGQQGSLSSAQASCLRNSLKKMYCKNSISHTAMRYDMRYIVQYSIAYTYVLL